MNKSAITTLIVLGHFLALVPVTSAAEIPAYRIVERIKVPDGGFDYATYDPASGNIYVARTDFTTVVEGKSGKLSQLNNASRGHMALPVPGTSLLVLPQARGMVRIADAATDSVAADIQGGQAPDGATYDSFSKLVFVMNHDGGDATVLDPVARKVVATIPIGGKLEFPVSDGLGRIFVNDQSSAEIAVIDVSSQKLTNRYKLAGCEEPTGLAYVASTKLLISSCRNGVAKVLHADTGNELATIPIGAGPDAVIYDAPRQLAFIPCGRDGVLEVISLADLTHIAVIQHVMTQVGSRTGTVDTQTGRLYLMAFKADPAQPNGRLSGSFEVLVIGH